MPGRLADCCVLSPDKSDYVGLGCSYCVPTQKPFCRPGVHWRTS